MSGDSDSTEIPELRQEIARLTTIIDALVEHSESLTIEDTSDFGIFQKTVLLETEVRNRTLALDRAIQELKSTNRRLVLTKGKFQALFDLLPNPATVTTLDSGTIVDVNNRFCEVFGFQKEAIAGMQKGSQGIGLWPEDSDRAAFIEALKEGGGAVHGMESRLKTASGALKTFLLSGRTLMIEGESLLIMECQDIGDYTQKLTLLRDIAERDALTGILNRRIVMERLEQAVLQLGGSGSRMAIAYLDLDGFKEINDRHGHSAGDRILVAVAARLMACIRDGDTLGRLGGDEFALLLHGVQNDTECEKILTDIIGAIGQPFDLPGGAICHIGISIGYTIAPDDASSDLELLDHADRALYLAKKRGKNRIARYRSSHACC